ncbi:hypothetical protein H8B06_03070 [Sphingobacterium sp. DN00404]|uniref:DUF3325 domain-containing protein n=1 Tax=Sphingobacterium micropteri TaxID=2763501 RepID=A0ABR7YKK6_9SPHI|nr:hypothetical protein [Sphingobacterium micropteri]MBD1431794.1 hypothetical protein [Sphingobacterium micropteri]
MYSLLFLILFAGCYLCYITSKKAKLGKVPPGFLRVAQSGKKAKIIASVLFIASWAIIIHNQGFGSGTFAFGGYVMAALSVVILLNPLRYIRWTHLLGIFILSILLETCIF